MFKKNLFLLLASLMVVLFTSCEKDDPIIPNEEELITTLTYTLVPQNGGETVVMIFRDLDGYGGDEPIITSESLISNSTYVGTLSLQNELTTPVTFIDEEIKEEDEDHQFFFQSTASGITLKYNDFDENDNPLGLITTLETGDATTGALTIILRHEPNKTADGVSNGMIENAGGETDIEVTFNLNVE